MTRSRKWQIVAVLVLSSGRWQLQAQTPASPAEPALNSFRAIQNHFDQKAEQSRKEIEIQRLEALQSFLPRAPEAEREPVLGSMVELSLSLELNDRAVSLADEFLKTFAKSEDRGTIRKMRLMALTKSGKLDEARKDWTAFLGEVKEETFSDVLEAGFQLAEAQADAGDTKSARTVYADIRDKLPNAATDPQVRANVSQQLEQMVSMRLDMLDWVGKAPPEIRGKTLDGKSVDLASYTGKVVLLDFWATWCGPCVAALPELQATYEKHHEKGFEIIGISLDMDVEQLKQFVQRQRMTWPQIWDNQEVANLQNPFGGPNTRRYSLSAIPATFLIDKDGKIARAGVSGKALGEAVSRLLSKAASQPATGAAGRAQ